MTQRGTTRVIVIFGAACLVVVGVAIMMRTGAQPPPYVEAVAIQANELPGTTDSNAGKAYRVRVRPPCFAIMSALPTLLVGEMIADIIPTFGSVNMIGGELDR